MQTFHFYGIETVKIPALSAETVEWLSVVRAYLDLHVQQQRGVQRQAPLRAQRQRAQAGPQPAHRHHAVPQQPPALLVRRHPQHRQLRQHHLPRDTTYRCCLPNRGFGHIGRQA